ncbi:MAG: PstC family ABC transporter permease, partial [Candidatus Hadarchaeia archaeon]
VKETFGLPVGETAFTAGIILGIMVLPIIISVSEDAMSSVPEKYRSASLALGATRWQTMTKVVIPSAASGISSSIILAFGRAIGETIAVMMIVGGSPIMPLTIFKPVRPMPATIAAEMGEIAYGSTHFHALFAIGIILLTTTFVTNYVAKKIMTRGVIEE